MAMDLAVDAITAAGDSAPEGVAAVSNELGERAGLSGGAALKGPNGSGEGRGESKGGRGGL